MELELIDFNPIVFFVYYNILFCIILICLTRHRVCMCAYLSNKQILICSLQLASTCFNHQITTSSMGLRFTLNQKMRHRAPVKVTVRSQSAVQMWWKKTASRRKLAHQKQMKRHASETQYIWPVRQQQVCRQTFLLKRLRAHTFKCKVPSRQSTNYICVCFIYF